MITGRFDSQGRPYVESRLVIPRLGVDESVVFLVDTGASYTCLHPWDARVAGIPFERLRDMSISRGVGGSARYFREPAVLSFTDERLRRLYEIDLLIAEPHERGEGLPSLLGRDVINHWYMHYDPSNESLRFEVRRTDLTLSLS